MDALLEFLTENKEAICAGAAAVILGAIWIARKVAEKTKSTKDDETVERISTKLALLAEVLNRLGAQRDEDGEQEVRKKQEETGHL